MPWGVSCARSFGTPISNTRGFLAEDGQRKGVFVPASEERMVKPIDVALFDTPTSTYRPG